MDVRIVDFPRTQVAALEHHGSPEREYETVRRLVEWRQANHLQPGRHRSYGIHYNDPRTTPPADYRVDFCIAIDGDVAPNPQGVVTKYIPACRCAVVRHHGSRENVSAAFWLYEVWLPRSGERAGSFPIFFHYVNVGPDLRDDDMITDVYLPLA